MSARVELRNVTKRFGAVEAVRDVSLDIAAGEFLTLLGPSGCGKTTLLRLLAGFEQPTSGSIWLNGREVTPLPPYRRPVNQVFQSYALFPHLSVRENVAFGLRMQRVPAAETAGRVGEALELVSSRDWTGAIRINSPAGSASASLWPAPSCAGHRSCCWTNRCPRSTPSCARRCSSSSSASSVSSGSTFVFVTHDQEEALTMSDRIAIVNGGRIEQLGTAHEIYHRPATRFAADFVGEANLLASELLELNADSARVRVDGGLELVLPASAWPAGETTALVTIRPEKIHVSRQPVKAANTFEARVEEEVFKGATDHLRLATAAGTPLAAVVANESALGEIFHAGDWVFCGLHADDLVVLRA
jgi:spermidine/putrescine transport system ATP-binding protein